MTGCIPGLADAEFPDGTFLCLKHAARKEGVFRLLPRDARWSAETRQYIPYRYVSRRELDKMNLLMRFIGKAKQH